MEIYNLWNKSKEDKAGTRKAALVGKEAKEGRAGKEVKTTMIICSIEPI